MGECARRPGLAESLPAKISTRWVRHLVFDAPPLLLVGVLVGVSLLKVGIGSLPNLPLSRSITANPFENLLAEAGTHYLFTSWLALLLAWATGSTGEGSPAFADAALYFKSGSPWRCAPEPDFVCRSTTATSRR